MRAVTIRGAGRRNRASIGRFRVGPLAAAALVAAAAWIVPAGQAVAGNSSSSGGTNCSTSERESYRDIGCMHAWWDNSPPLSSGVALGSKWGLESYCAHYGTVKAHIDLQGAQDERWTLRQAGKERGQANFGEVRDISCCRKDSDICHKGEVEKNSQKKIRVWSGSGKSYDWVSVSTHKKRYDFCQDHPDNVYCENNPDGDALRAPSCGDANCTDSDCEDEYDNNVLTEICDLTDATVTNTETTTTVTATCRLQVLCRPYGMFRGDETFAFDTVSTVKFCQLEDFSDNPDNLPTKLFVAECPDGYVAEPR